MAKGSSAEMPFLDHLEELRWRLFWCLGAVVVGMIVGFVLVTRIDVIGLLARPMTPFLAGNKLVYTSPADPFGIVLKAAFGVGLVLALPVILYQTWAFVSPALYQHEKKVVIPLIVGAVALFVSGVTLAYFVILPMTLNFLTNFASQSLAPMITASGYFGFAIGMSLAFGAAFELPIVILAATALGLVTPQTLNRFRRHAVVACAAGAAFITPGADISSMFALAVPLYFLYEFSILVSYVVFRKRERSRKAAEDAAAAERAGGHEATA